MRRVTLTVSARPRWWLAGWPIAWLVVPAAAFAQAKPKAPAAAATQAVSTLERIRTSGMLKLGYRIDARPFSYQEPAVPAGYSVELCQNLAESVKNELNVPAVTIKWVPVTVDNQLRAVEQHEIDVLCGSVSVTLQRRKQVDFSAPIFPGGVGALVRSDAPRQLVNILAGKAQDYRPTWRAVALNILREQTFATISGTTAEQWVNQRGNQLQVEFQVTPVPSYDAGVQAVVDRKASAFFGERAALLEEARRHSSASRLTVIDRQFTYEPLALVVARGDDDFRLLVDRSLSRFYSSPGFGTMYTKWFGIPDEIAKNFFRWNALPE
jgi:ABC-type amino acid transport substrate-binding protein